MQKRLSPVRFSTVVSLFEPNLDLLRQAFGNRVEGCQPELIRVSLGWSRVYRVTLTHRGHSTRRTVIVKTVDPNGPSTAHESIRELCFYRTIQPKLPITKPEIHYLTTDEATGFHVIVMEDLAPTHRIPTHPHQWTRDELKAVLRAYARLHTSTDEILPYDWLAPRHEDLLDFDKIPKHVAIVQRARLWGELPELAQLIAYGAESCKRFADAKTTLLHNDTTPPNAPLPQDLDSLPATLIDWQDVGLGMPEFDLAYIDLQPFESGRLLPRPELLDLYWRFRAEIGSDLPTPEERRDRQLHADIVIALWLTTPASRVALQPYPPETYPHLHWASQYGIVYNRLRTLAQEIQNR
jgi:aminoglycoside phosphotransferase (APT) family kinase protein